MLDIGKTATMTTRRRPKKSQKVCLNAFFFPSFFIRGSVVCDEILCPTVTCEKPFLPEGECCPLCNTNITTNAEETEDQGTGCFLEGDQILHPPGSKWHPYIPPFGFSRCATCTCDPESLKVECQSQKCPRLDCPADQQFRPDALACCKVLKKIVKF